MPKIDNVDINCPTCLDAGRGAQRMQLRTNGVSGEEFLGCRLWPKCNRTQQVPAWLEMKRAGYAELPGFEGAS